MQAGSSIVPTTQVEVDVRGKRRRGRSFSNGSVESIFKAIDNAVGMKGSLADYQVRAISAGKDALAEVNVSVEVGGGQAYNGQAVSFDVMEATAKAYVRALNNAANAGEGPRSVVDYRDRREANGNGPGATADSRASGRKKES
jgi:2-isopropylmalate synthase